MAEQTRAEALRKVETIVVGVGYPDSWRDYSRYEVSADNAYANAINGERAEYAHQLAKLGQPMDRNEWWMTPQTVNAVNLPVQNALNFPAAILQPPFFNPSADAAYNYGAIGAVIGHEISHSFDNNGAAFDVNRRAAQLVDGGRSGQLPHARRSAGSPVRYVRTASRPARQRHADARREHRRRGGPCKPHMTPITLRSTAAKRR